MNVVFRRDDRPESGLGHVMRCDALAFALQKLGHRTGIAPHADDGVPPADLIVVDSYAATSADLSRWSEVAPICVIDDLGDRDLSAASIIVNQNAGAEQLQYRSGAATLLLGPSYAMLRPQFCEVRLSARREFAVGDNRLLLTLGGGKVSRLLGDVLDVLELAESKLQITVLGAQAKLRASTRHEIDFKAHEGQIAAEMLRADMCITGGGVSTLELACVGTPMIVVTLAANQEPGAATLRDLGAAVVAGPFESALPSLAADVGTLAGDPERRRALSDAAMSIVDGLGAERVARRLEAMWA